MYSLYDHLWNSKYKQQYSPYFQTILPFLMTMKWMTPYRINLMQVSELCKCHAEFGKKVKTWDKSMSLWQLATGR